MENEQRGNGRKMNIEKSEMRKEKFEETDSQW